MPNTYEIRLFFSRLRNFGRQRRNQLQAAVVILLAITIPAFAYAVQNPVLWRPRANQSGVKLYLAPETQLLPPDKTLQVMVSAQNNKIAFIQTEVVFDPAKVQLAREPLTGQSLKKVIFIGDLAEANRTGRLKLAYGLDPADKAQAPTQSFAVASLIFRSATSMANQSTTVSFSTDKTELITLDERLIQPALGGSNLTLNQTTVSPSPATSPNPTSSPNSGSGPTIDKFVLVDVSTKAELRQLDIYQPITINYQQLPKFTIKAVTGNGVKSVRFVYKANYRSQPQPAVVDNNQPFTIVCDGGDRNWICPWDVGVGTYDISVTPYTGNKAQGTAGQTYQFTIQVTDNATPVTAVSPAPAPQPSPSPSPSPQLGISRIDMINVANGSVIKTINTGQLTRLKLSDYPKYTLKAVTTPETVGSVRFVYKANYRSKPQPAVIDHKQPYTIVCDGGSQNWICPWDVGVGTYDISITPYSAANAKGTAGQTLNFTIKVE